MGNLIIKTKFISPVPHKTYWKNQLWNKYKEISDYPLTVITAGPGYGKSTSLASFFSEKYNKNYYWYSIDEMDADPVLFFLNLIHSFRYRDEEIGQKAIELLSGKNELNPDLTEVIDRLINDLLIKVPDDSYLILDDFHFVSDNGRILELLAHFINRLPPTLHFVIATREGVGFKERASWHLKRRLLLVTEEDLVLNNSEIVDFFESQYDIKLSPEDVDKVWQETEGWIMALALIGRGMTNGAGLQDILLTNTESLEILFEYMAYEVLENQSEFTKLFLLKTAALKYLQVNICNKLLAIENSKEIIDQLVRKSLFIYKLGDGQYRYHHLFHEFLRKIGKERHDYPKLHAQTAAICLQLGERGLAIYHFLEAGDYQQAAELILSSADRLLELGRLDTLQSGLNKLPEKIFARYPLLYNYQGDIFRLRSEFDQALDSYKKARDYFRCQEEKLNLSRTLQKIAMIYLDTVQPVRAEKYLSEALRLIDQENQWEESILLKLISENKANEGQLAEALKIQQKAEALDRGEMAPNNISARVLLRTGKLDQAQQVLEEKLTREKARARIPRSHRESILILSLIHSFKGEVHQAYQYAQGGICLGEQLNSPFIIAVAYMRLGHALQLYGDAKREQVMRSYHKSLEIVDELRVVRGRAEPLMGMALFEGFYGEPDLGIKYGEEGCQIARQAGDEWLTGLLYLALGVNYYFAGRLDRAEQELKRGEAIFIGSNDSFLLTVIRLWLLLIYYNHAEWPAFNKLSDRFFNPAIELGYQYLFYQATFLGMRDCGLFVPLLLKARDREMTSSKATPILAQLGYTDINSHPGYSLRIKAFNSFRVYRGKEEINKKEWQRAKAKELFLLFLIRRGDFIPKERIFDLLWPEEDEKTAARNFKVALNALKKALEPQRKPRQKPFFIKKYGSNYGLNLKAGFYFDVTAFEDLIEAGNRYREEKRKMDCFRSAVDLYQGDFLADNPYIDWLREERERMRGLFLSAADQLVKYYFRIKDYHASIAMTERILVVDLAWEPAYLYQIKSYERLNCRSLAIKTYQKCKEVMERELNVLPMAAIEDLYKRITS